MLRHLSQRGVAAPKKRPAPKGAGLEGGSAPGRTCAGSALLLGEEASERTSSLAAMLATSRMECGENLNIPTTSATLRETADKAGLYNHANAFVTLRS